MAEARRYIGVRISEQGHRYIQLVEEREKAAGNDRFTYSAALRHLLALGVRADQEAHDGTSRTSVERSAATRHERADDGRGDRDLNGDGSSGEVPHLPDPAGIGEAIGHLVHAGLNPSAVPEENDGPSAA